MKRGSKGLAAVAEPKGPRRVLGLAGLVAGSVVMGLIGMPVAQAAEGVAGWTVRQAPGRVAAQMGSHVAPQAPSHVAARAGSHAAAQTGSFMEVQVSGRVTARALSWDGAQRPSAATARAPGLTAARAPGIATAQAPGLVATRAPAEDIPDLALVVAGDTGRTNAWHSGESAFARLWALLQPTYTGTERVSEEWEEGRYPSVRVTVVWGLTGIGGWPQTNRAPDGDVAVEREDQLFLTGDGTPWVRTDPAPDVADDDIRWHRAPRSVFEQLDRAGLLGGTVGGRGKDSYGPVGPAGGVWWAAAGLALGVGGTLLICRAAARHEAGPPREEPRQELIDL